MSANFSSKISQHLNSGKQHGGPEKVLCHSGLHWKGEEEVPVHLYASWANTRGTREVPWGHCNQGQ